MLDKLRSAYASSPPALRKKLSPFLALIPVRYRYGRTFFDTQQNMLRAQDNIQWLEQERLSRLRQLVSAANNTSYYRQVFTQVFGSLPEPEKFTFDDLAKLPILSKEVLRDRAGDLLAVPQEQADLASTSGSSGRPLKFWLDKNRGAKEFAYITNFWSRIGFEVGKSRRAVFRGVQMENADKQSWQWDPALLELRLSAFHMQPKNMHEFCDLIEEYKIEFLHGYPSAISLLAQYLLHAKRKPPKMLRGILPASEPTLPEQQALFVRAFPDIPIMRYYGMSEKVVIAAQRVNDPNIYESEPLYGHAEIVGADGAPVACGEKGRIVGTGFISYAMPLLRYDMEDEATLLEPACRENEYRLVMQDIVGSHRSDYIVGKGGELMPFTALNAHGEAYTRLHSFQFYQDTIGEVVIKAVAQDGLNEQDLQPFVKELRDRVGSVVHFELRLMDDIPFATSNGKRPFIDQRLDLSQYLQQSESL